MDGVIVVILFSGENIEAGGNMIGRSLRIA